MLTLILGSVVAIFMVLELREEPAPEQPVATIYVPDNLNQIGAVQKTQIKSESEAQFEGIVRQTYDYSCGSAALTTLMRSYLGLNVNEQQVMLGMLRFGETERIQARRSFSMLDMKRLTEALGYAAGGFSGELSDLEQLEHPAIVSIDYAGFKHFVVIKRAGNGRVFVADPALGNRSFTYSEFKDIWQHQVLFMAFPGDRPSFPGLALTAEDLRLVDEAAATDTWLSYRDISQTALSSGSIDHQLQKQQYNAYWVEGESGRRLVTPEDKDFNPNLADTFDTRLLETQEKIQNIRYRR